jgi:transcriptional regulator with XRE-family HTH domain
MTETSEIGALIERAMKARKWNRKTLALAVGVTETTLSRWISGQRTPGKHQAKLMQTLGLSPDQVAAGAPVRTPAQRYEAGRWQRYAMRYPAFGEHARDALAGGVPEATLDRAADSLGEHKGDGPTSDEARQAIVDAIRRVDPWRRMHMRDATTEDFEEGE